jgi:hypothetical protein
MLKKKSQELRVEDLVIGKVYWSNSYEQYIIYVESDYDYGYIFKFTSRDGYCVPKLYNIVEAPALLQELFDKEDMYDR